MSCVPVERRDKNYVDDEILIKQLDKFVRVYVVYMSFASCHLI